MKNRNLRLSVYVLAMMFVLYNCKKKEEPFPTRPNPVLVDNLNKIEVENVTLTQPAAVTTTPATFTASPKTTELTGALGGIGTSGTVPANVQAAAGEVTAALTPAEINTLVGTTPATFSAIAAGGAVPTNLKTILDKARANPALAAYFPTYTLPTVNGTAVNSGRDGVDEGLTEGIEKTQGIEVEDACVQASTAAYEARLAVLTTQRDQQLAAATTAYNNATQGLAADEAACKAGIPATYDAYRQNAQTQANQALANLAAAQSILGSNYPYLQALVNLQLVGFLETVNNLQTAAENACTATTAAKTAAAQAARNANNTAINAAFNTARTAAQAARTQMYESCHNQGAGW